MLKEHKKEYYNVLESRFIGMNQRFDKAPHMMLAANAICALMYLLAKGIASDLGNDVIINFLTVILGISVLCSIIYVISALLKNSKKTFPIAFLAVFITFVLIWNMISVNLSIRDLESLIE